MRTWILLACFAAATGIAACDNDDSSGGPEEVVDSYVTSYCEKLLACCESAQLSDKFDGAVVADRASCESEMDLLGLLELSLRASLEHARIELHEGALDACLQTLEALPCADFRAQPLMLCDGYVEGLVPEGQACSSDYECAGDSYCDGDLDVCKRLPVEGEACTEKCAEGVYCQIGESGAHCVAKDDNGAPCNYATTCKGGACAISEGATSGTCTTNDECTAGLIHLECEPCSAPAP